MTPQNEQDFKQAFQTLMRLGYDVTSLRDQHRERIEAHAARKPTPTQERYILSTPESWMPHFENTDGHAEIPTFSTATMRNGGQFLLTPGQRKVLKERYGMTPTKLVEVHDISLFPGTKVVEGLTLTAVIHVDEMAKRRHVLTRVVISNFAAFMDAAQETDAEKVTEEKEPRAHKEKKSVRAVQDLLAEFGM